MVSVLPLHAGRLLTGGTVLGFALYPLALFASAPAALPQVDIEQYQLGNGLTVVLAHVDTPLAVVALRSPQAAFARRGRGR